MKRPPAFIIGAPKCGTTTVFETLSRHPDVEPSENKEPHIFDLPNRGDARERMAETFSDGGGERLRVEATPDYFHLPYAVDSLSEIFPEAKVVLLLRDPVDRAYSEWWMYWTRGTEPLPVYDAIQEALEFENEVLEGSGGISPEQWEEHYTGAIEGPIVNRTYTIVGRYSLHLEYVTDCFREDQVHIGFLEDLKEDPETTMGDILRFLNLDRSAVESVPAQNQALGPLARPLARGLRKLRLKPVVDAIPDLIREPLKQVTAGAGQRPPLPRNLESHLRSHYKESIAHLQEILGDIPSSWLAPTERSEPPEIGEGGKPRCG